MAANNKKSRKKRKETKSEATKDERKDIGDEQKGPQSHPRRLGLPVIGVTTLVVLAISVCFSITGQESSSLEHSNASQLYKQGQDEKKCRLDDTNSNANSEASSQCGIWIAKSTLPNAGLGVFAGRDFATHQELGIDRVIPIVDLSKYQGSGWPFLWNSYLWNADRSYHDADADVSMAMPGFGSATNAHQDLHNVNMGSAQPDSTAVAASLLDRSKDPGAGASTVYSERMTVKEDVKAGQELFLNYGDAWFVKRTWHMGAIPLQGDTTRANTLFKDTRALQKKNELREEIFQEYWERFVWQSPYSDDSRVLAALPKNWTSLDQVAESDLKTHLQHQSTNSLKWLEQNGVCAGNFKPGASQLPQAGRGAFAARALVNNSIVAPLPLIHIPFRHKLEMQDQTQQQLLLNYCYGHRQSTLLLCPYGIMTAYINHSQQRPNVKIQWPLDLARSSNHHPDWLYLAVEDLWSQKQTAGLAFEMVALRDIEEGEEILLNYGDEWEVAWQKHVEAYKTRLDDYVSPMILNNAVTLKTQEEQRQSPYPLTSQIMMDTAFVHSGEWKDERWSQSAKTLLEWKKLVQGGSHLHVIHCQILERRHGSYKVKFSDDGQDHVLDGLPREAFEFKDKPYQSEIYLPNSFRHDMRIPDDMFPEAWKNIR